MSKLELIRVFGVIGAVASAAVLVLNGDYISAAGVISAAFGSATTVVRA